MSASPGRKLVRAAWALAVALVAILALKMFVCDVKQVDSASMEPTIHGSPDEGESVLVLYGSFAPDRFDTVVIAREGEDLPLVKRVAGLPKESVQVSNGDLLIDGRRLPPETPRPPPIPVFDSSVMSVDEAFARTPGAEPRWAETADGWELDATDTAPASLEASMTFHRPLRDGYLAPDGRFEPGQQDVNDAVFECEVRFPEPGGAVFFELVEQGDAFRFQLEASGPGSGVARILRAGVEPAGESSGPSEAEVLESLEVPLAASTWIPIRCANVDNALTLEIGGSGPLCHVYAENRFHASDRLRQGRSFGPRVRFGGGGGRFGFRGIRVLRDVYYTARDVYGVDEPAELGPDEYFVLGDNSAESRDSREWGPVRRAAIAGRPVAVLWPLRALRRIPPPRAGPCGR